jgi:hypothetical protein
VLHEWLRQLQNVTPNYVFKKEIMNNNNNKTEIDVEQYSREGKDVPKGHHYIIMVDQTKYKTEKECMTGKEILLLAGKTPPEKFQLQQRMRDKKVKRIALDQVVCFTEPGIEKFLTMPLDSQEGARV